MIEAYYACLETVNIKMLRCALASLDPTGIGISPYNTEVFNVYLCALQEFYSVFKLSEHLMYTTWSERVTRMLDITDPKGMLVQSCRRI